MRPSAGGFAEWFTGNSLREFGDSASRLFAESEYSISSLAEPLSQTTLRKRK